MLVAMPMFVFTYHHGVKVLLSLALDLLSMIGGLEGWQCLQV